MAPRRAPRYAFAMPGPHSASAIARRGKQFWGTRTCDREALGVAFQLLDATEEELEPHVHEDQHYIFVLAGNYLSTAKGAPQVASTPILIDNPAGTAHCDQFLGPGGRFLAISIPAESTQEGHATASRGLDDIRAMFRLVDELDFADSALPLEEFALLFKSGRAPAPEGPPPGWLPRTFDAVMEEHADRLTMDQLAIEAGVHPVHVARTFRRHLGKTAGELLRARQFERACDRLLDHDEPLATIAHDLGYYDQAHFSHMFAKRAGCTPGQWRKSNQPKV